MTQGAADRKKLLSSGTIFLRCTFVGGDDERGGFTGEQLRYPCKLRRHICAECGMHRGEHGGRPSAGVRVRDEDLPPRKRAVFRARGELQPMVLDLGGGEDEGDGEREGQAWATADAIAKGKRGGRRRRAAWREL